jgi:hypothetical protein
MINVQYLRAENERSAEWLCTAAELCIMSAEAVNLGGSCLFTDPEISCDWCGS